MIRTVLGGLARLINVNERSYWYRFYNKRFSRLCARHGYKLDTTSPAYAEYRRLWSVFDGRVEPYSFAFFAPYVGECAGIIPENIGVSYIEKQLNPVRYRDYYSDKNTYGLYIDHKYLPGTVARRINGGCIVDEDYRMLDLDAHIRAVTLPRLILKPSVDSNSGTGVRLFVRDTDGTYRDTDGRELSAAYLLDYGNDWILQEAVTQHSYISQFCSSAVNTLRVGTYRSVTDEDIVVIGSIMRIGREGAFVDNAHCGGLFVGIDPVTGTLNDYMCDQYGNRYSQLNSFSLAPGKYTVPHWDRVLRAVKDIARRNIHMRLLAFDIAIDADGNPVFIEYNTEGFSYWLFQLSGQLLFRDHLSEVIEYCNNRKGRKLKLRTV